MVQAGASALSARGTRDAALVKVFKAFDINGSGHIDKWELHALGHARQSLGHKDRQWNSQKNTALLNKMDINKDGKIVREEFVHFFESALPRPKAEFDEIIGEFMLAADHCHKEVGLGRAFLSCAYEYDMMCTHEIWIQSGDRGVLTVPFLEGHPISALHEGS